MASRFARVYGAGKAFAATKQGMAVIGGTTVACAGLQMKFGHTENFIERKFKTNKNPDDLVDFYSGEDLLKIIAFDENVFKLMLSGTRFQEVNEGENLRGKPLDGKTTVSSIPVMPQEVMFTLTEEEVDTTGDGEADTVGAFTKCERFTAYVPIFYQLGIKILIFDTTWEYGYHRMSNGILEVFHRGVEFIGPWPALPIMMMHQGIYAIWAVKKHVNSPFFGSEEDGAWDKKEEELANLPLYVFENYLRQLRENYKTAIEEGQPPTESQKVTLEKLETMAQNLPTKIQISKTTSSKGMKLSSTAITTDDPETQAILNAANRDIVDAKRSRALSAVMQEVVQHPDLEWTTTKKHAPSSEGLAATDGVELSEEESPEAAIAYGAFGKSHARDGQCNKFGSM